MRKALVADEFEDEQDEYVEDQYITDDIHGNKSSESVVIKDEPGNVNHAKIISEVLKKYPHLVKNNKNIKLKIMQRGNQQTISAPIISPPPLPVATVKAKIVPPVDNTQPKAPKKIDSKTMHALIALGAENVTGPWLCLKCGVNGRPISIPSYKGFRRHLINSHKERIDPLICEHCGQRTSKRAELFHHMLIQHNVKLPLGVRLPKCTDCKYFAVDGMDLKKHRDEEHKKVVTAEKLNTHHCIYCNKTFSNEIRVYEHMRANHRQRACDDGVMDFDEEDDEDQDKYVPNNEQAGSSNENKIKIISNIALPSISSIGNASTSAASHHQQNMNLEPSSEAEGLSNVASGIATSLGVLDADSHDEYNTSVDDEHSSATQTLSTNYIEEAMANVHGEYMGNVNKKQLSMEQVEYINEQLHEGEEEEQDVTQFVTAEGSTLELTASQKADLLQQLQDQSGVVMILNDDDFDHNQQIVEHSDQQGIVVVYSQPDEVNNSTCVTTTASTSNGIELAAASDSQDSMITAEPNWQNEDNDKADAEIKNETEEEMETSMNADEDMDVSKDPLEDEEELNDNKEKEEKEAAAAATKKLIEVDWSEDDENDHIEAEPADDTKSVENPKSIPSAFQSSTAKRSYKGSRDAKAATTSNKTDETNKGELDDLEKASDDLESKHEAEEAAADTETPAGDESNEIMTENDAEVESTSGTANISKALPDKTSTKAEINTLINDWGDDDEDEDDEDKN